MSYWEEFKIYGSARHYIMGITIVFLLIGIAYRIYSGESFISVGAGTIVFILWLWYVIPPCKPPTAAELASKLRESQ